MKKDLDFLFEWAIWAGLDSKNDIELILLKGHLLLENVLGVGLKRSGVSKIEMLSFHKRILEFEKVKHLDSNKKNQIIFFLRVINRLRNRLAHEYNFKIENSELMNWSNNVLSKLEGTKFTKFTPRTRIVHAFSTLGLNIIELEHLNDE